MKKTLLYASLWVAPLSMAQTIATTDTLTAGNVIQYYAVDTSITNLDGVTGAGVTWDYSQMLMSDNSPASSKDSVIHIADSPNQNDFPNATYHEQFTAGPQTFFSNDGNEVTIHGFMFNAGADYIIKYDDDQMIGLQLPMALNDQINDPIQGEAVIPSFGTINLTGNSVAVADGTGTLLLGGNTYNDVIRVKTTETSSGTTLGQTIVFTRISYAYYTQNTPTNFPIFIHGEINADLSLAGNINLKTVWSIDDSGFHLSQTPFDAPLELSIYPNPADKQVMVTSSEETQSIQIFNAIGEVVYSNTKPSAQEEINTAELTAGIYFVQIKSKAETLTKKLIIK